MSDKTPKMYYSNVDEEIDSQTILRQKNDRMIRNTIGVLFLSILVLGIVMGVNPQKMTGALQPSQPTSEAFGDIDTSHDPLQAYYSGETIIRKFEHEEFTITPVARYEVSAMVAGMKSYNDDESRLMPVDIALVWGKLAEPEYDKHVSYSQSGRWYFYQYDSGSPFDNNFVITHSANTHIIPANDGVYKAIKTINNKEKVSLSGFLVNLMGKDDRGRTFSAKTSLTRTDTGAGSCEILYVTKVRIGNNIYE